MKAMTIAVFLLGIVLLLSYFREPTPTHHHISEQQSVVKAALPHVTTDAIVPHGIQADKVKKAEEWVKAHPIAPPRVDDKSAIADRKSFAEYLDEKHLRDGIESKTFTYGDRSEILVIQEQGANRVGAYKIYNDGVLLANLHARGFQELIYTDGSTVVGLWDIQGRQNSDSLPRGVRVIPPEELQANIRAEEKHKLP